MARFALILAVIAFCVLTAAKPDPRMQAAIEALTANHAHQSPEDVDGSFYCPMDPDIRSLRPGTCPKCGMTLVDGIPDIVDYPFEMTAAPDAPVAGAPVRLTFAVRDPETGAPVRQFDTVHERLYHVFLVSQDLSFFVHTHPERASDTDDFHLDVTLPRPGLYRVLSDFLPHGGTPQLPTATLIVGGGEATLAPTTLRPDLSAQASENARVELSLSGPVVARQTTGLEFRLLPGDGLEPYLGAWGHMLAASADLIDMVHGHPAATRDGVLRDGKTLRFDMAFPRAGVYRVWVQFQRAGVVNTVAFNIPVTEPT